MRIIEVIPISRGIARESLSYFTREKPKNGSIVSIPLRSKKIDGLVISSKTVSKRKAEIKTKTYAIKKVEKLKAKSFFLPEFIESAAEASEYFATSTGAILNELISKPVLENIEELKVGKIRKNASEKFVIQAPLKDRLSNYKSLVREEFAKGRSVIICSPTIRNSGKMYDLLKKSIEEYVFHIHSSLPKKEIVSTFKEILEKKHPILIVTTGRFLSIPRNDIGLIILENESSRFYKKLSRPFIDYRKFSEILAKNLGVKLIFGDTYLRTETIWRYKEGELLEINPLKFRSLSSVKSSLIYMKSKKFKVLGAELEKLIKKKENLFIFCARKGLHPLTLCRDCGEVFKCERCDAPVVLHKSGKDNFFLCHRCGRKQTTETRCRKCNSWKLEAVGIGIEFVEKILKEEGVKVFRLDSSSGSTLKKAQKIVSDFKENKGAVLLGTEMALGYLDSVDNSAIVSMDSFFSIPDFRISEKIFNLLLDIREKTKNSFLVQTRNKEHNVLKLALSGNLADFYRAEIKQREDFNFPPFVVFIKITIMGNRKVISKEMKELKEYLEGYSFDIYPGFISKIRGKYVLNGLITLDKWPNKDLLEKLLSLPPKFAINVDPDNLL